MEENPLAANDGAGAAHFPAVYHNGREGDARRVELSFGPALEIFENGVLLAAWGYADIRRLASPDGLLRLRSLGAAKAARLDIADPEARRQALTHCRMLEGERNAHVRPSWRPFLLTAAGAAGLIGMIWAGVPYLADRIAPLVPLSWEKKLGEMADTDVKEKYASDICEAPAGAAALEKLSKKLQAAAHLRLPATIVAVSSAVPNAFALPGGKVYLFSALLDKAQTQDEIAGVLAHELGHLQNRDHLRRMIAEGGIAYLFGLALGDAAGGGAVVYAGKALIGARNSRQAEAKADEFAAQTMARLHRSAKPMGDLLLRVTGPESDGLFTILHDHPLSEDRLAWLAAADKGAKPASGPPPLTDAEWTALKKICEKE